VRTHTCIYAYIIQVYSSIFNIFIRIFMFFAPRSWNQIILVCLVNCMNWRKRLCLYSNEHKYVYINMFNFTFISVSYKNSWFIDYYLSLVPSQSSNNQRNSDSSDHFPSGRITPPATNLPRFKKYTVTDFNFLKVRTNRKYCRHLTLNLSG